MNRKSETSRYDHRNGTDHKDKRESGNKENYHKGNSFGRESGSRLWDNNSCSENASVRFVHGFYKVCSCFL